MGSGHFSDAGMNVGNVLRMAGRAGLSHLEQGLDVGENRPQDTKLKRVARCASLALPNAPTPLIR